MLVAACRWIFLPRFKPGTYSITSGFYLRRWGVSLLTETALDVLSSLFATVYMRGWYRLMGTRVGKGTEITMTKWER